MLEIKKDPKLDTLQKDRYEENVTITGVNKYKVKKIKKRKERTAVIKEKSIWEKIKGLFE